MAATGFKINMSDKKVIVIGAGFAGLSAATTLAKNGFEAARNWRSVSGNVY